MDQDKGEVLTLDPTLKAKWIAALRSGDYRQMRRKLCGYNGELCCIGVGAVVVDPTFKPTPDMITRFASRRLLLTDDQVDVLVGLNDRQEKSFAEIADYIEQNL